MSTPKLPFFRSSGSFLLLEGPPFVLLQYRMVLTIPRILDFVNRLAPVFTAFVYVFHLHVAGIVGASANLWYGKADAELGVEGILVVAQGTVRAQIEVVALKLK